MLLVTTRALSLCRVSTPGRVITKITRTMHALVAFVVYNWLMLVCMLESASGYCFGTDYAGQNAGGVYQSTAVEVVAPAGGDVIGMTLLADQVTVAGNKGTYLRISICALGARELTLSDVPSTSL
jgi:hypothetical protein